MFAYGIARAVNRGWIDASNMDFARKAFAGLAKNVTAEGVVKGTCQGTSIGRTLDFSVKRPQPDDDPHGRGPVMLAGAEILLAGKK
jgi:rhamnogalacturonyl hydrolase YesR